MFLISIPINITISRDIIKIVYKNNLLLSEVIFMVEQATRFEVVRTDPNSHIVRRWVIPFPGQEFNELAVKLFDPKDKTYRGHFVDNDTPVGERGRGKVFHYRLKSSHYQSKTINYEIKDGVIRFIDFNGLIVDGYRIDTRHSEDGDLLEVDLKKSKFAPTDAKEVNRIRYVLWAIQKFNNELLEEADSEDMPEGEEATDEDIQSEENDDNEEENNSLDENPNQNQDDSFDGKPKILG